MGKGGERKARDLTGHLRQCMVNIVKGPNPNGDLNGGNAAAPIVFTCEASSDGIDKIQSLGDFYVCIKTSLYFLLQGQSYWAQQWKRKKIQKTLCKVAFPILSFPGLVLPWTFFFGEVPAGGVRNHYRNFQTEKCKNIPSLSSHFLCLFTPARDSLILKSPNIIFKQYIARKIFICSRFISYDNGITNSQGRVMENPVLMSIGTFSHSLCYIFHCWLDNFRAMSAQK